MSASTEILLLLFACYVAWAIADFLRGAAEQLL